MCNIPKNGLTCCIINFCVIYLKNKLTCCMFMSLATAGKHSEDLNRANTPINQTLAVHILAGWVDSMKSSPVNNFVRITVTLLPLLWCGQIPQLLLLVSYSVQEQYFLCFFSDWNLMINSPVLFTLWRIPKTSFVQRLVRLFLDQLVSGNTRSFSP